MAILIFVLSLVLLVAGVGERLPEPRPAAGRPGPAVCGSRRGRCSAAAVVTFAIGVAILRIDALARLVRQCGGAGDPGPRAGAAPPGYVVENRAGGGLRGRLWACPCSVKAETPEGVDELAAVDDA